MNKGKFELKDNNPEVLVSSKRKQETQSLKENIKSPPAELNQTGSRKAENISKIQEEQKLQEVLVNVYTEKFEEALQIPILKLPSEGKIYPPDYKIFYRHYNYQEIEDINNIDITLYDRYNIMLQGISTQNMEKTDITFNDFNYISFTRRLLAQGATEFAYPYICTTCGNKSVYNYNLEQIEFSPLKHKMPLKVKFKSFKDEEFHFAPYTIGDILSLFENNTYYRTIGNVVLTGDSGNKIVDSVALLACCVTNMLWENAYEKLIIVGTNHIDRKILSEIDKALHHDVAPLKFNCNIQKEVQKEQNKVATDLVDDVVTGKLSLDNANDTKKMPTPNWLKALNYRNNMCNAENYIDVSGRDIIVPFCSIEESSEYGIYFE